MRAETDAALAYFTMIFLATGLLARKSSKIGGYKAHTAWRDMTETLKILLSENEVFTPATSKAPAKLEQLLNMTNMVLASCWCLRKPPNAELMQHDQRKAQIGIQMGRRNLGRCQG